MSLSLPSRPPFVVLDTETSGLHPDDGARVACVAITFPDVSSEEITYDGVDAPLRTVALPFDQGVRDKFAVAQLGLDLFDEAADPNLPESAWIELLDWLRRQSIIYHNAKFDMTMMSAGTRHYRGRDLSRCFHWDTMLAQRVLDPLEQIGLDATMKRLEMGGKDDTLTPIINWLVARKYHKRRYDLAPWDLVEPYVRNDTADTARLYLHQQRRLHEMDADDAQELRERIRVQFDLTIALYRMEQRGVLYDDDRSLEGAQALEAYASRIEAEMPFKAIESQGKAYFFGKLGLVPDRFSEKTGKPSLDEEQVRKFVTEGVQWAREYSEVTRARRAVSMWYRGYPEKIGHDGRLRTTFRQAHVKSGRMSVERVQLQAMPKRDKYNDIRTGERLPMYVGVPEVRDMFYAPEGYGLWNLDLSQAELRVAAHYSQCQEMLRMLAEGADMHAHTCEGTMHVSRDHPNWKEKRDIAKRLNFGGIFMIGGKTFQATLSKLADIHLPLHECNQMVRRWRALYPEFEYAYEEAMDHADHHGWVELCRDSRFAQESWFGPRDWPNTAWNRVVQGSLATVFAEWLGQIEKRWPGYMVLTVHDSIILECPVSEGDSIAAGVAEYGTELFTDAFGIQMAVDVDRWK